MTFQPKKKQAFVMGLDPSTKSQIKALKGHKTYVSFIREAIQFYIDHLINLHKEKEKNYILKKYYYDETC